MTAPASTAPTTPSRPGGVGDLGDPVLRFTDVAKAFPDGTVALEGVHLDVARGDFVTVVGPSGCGKSTLLRIASGLSPATAGTAQVDAARIGYVFQDATLLPWRTVAQNVALLAQLHGLDRGEARRATSEAIELVGLAGHEDKLPRALSGGMRMRTSLARSLTLDPDLFLFDEPFGALDEITRERLNDELLRLFVAKGFGALFITHSVSEAVYLSTRVVVMSGRPGHVVAEFEVPFGTERTPELRFTPEFAVLAGEVSRALREGHS